MTNGRIWRELINNLPPQKKNTSFQYWYESCNSIEEEVEFTNARNITTQTFFGAQKQMRFSIQKKARQSQI